MHHNKTATKTTVSLYLNRKVVEKARNHRLNLSRIIEQALSSILDYLETQNTIKSSNGSSVFLSRGSFLKENRMPRAGFEPETSGDITRTTFPFFVCGDSLLLGLIVLK
jgi:post-segregation antitoxin (ccd killing protein)